MMATMVLSLMLRAAVLSPAWSAVPTPLALVDDVGSTVLIAGPARRIVSVSPGATEILFALGAGDRVVGTCKFCDYPAAAARCPRVGDYANPSLEAIVAARPDLVVTGGPQRELVLHLRSAGIPAIVLLPRSIAGLEENIRQLGRALDRSANARALCARIDERLARVTRTAAAAGTAARPKVYFEIWADPFMAIGDDTYAGELIRLAGGDNIARGAPGEYPKLSAEAILAANPDVIILSHCDDAQGALHAVAGRPGWAQLAAVRNRRVYGDLNMDLLLRPGPRLVEGLAQLRARLAP